jgi:hypothetical protein
MLLFTLSGVSKRPQNDNADPPSPQWAPSKGRVLTAVFKRTGASGRGVRTSNEGDGNVRTRNEDDDSSRRQMKTTVASRRGVRTGNKDDGRVTTRRQDG